MIINNTNYTFSPSAQQAIENAMANLGVDTVYTGKHPNDGNNGTLFSLFDENDVLLFSIDTEGDEIF